MPDFVPDNEFVPDSAASPVAAAAPSSDFIPDEKFVDDEEKYGSIGQQAIAGLEGAASAMTFGLSTGVERALGVPAEDIRIRREVNPIAHTAGELGGIGVGLLYGAGEAALLERAGVKAASMIAGEGALAKIGSTAARLATENALFQAGDEVSKMFAGDPNQTVGTVVADIGLSTLIGGGFGTAFGAASPLWKATVGNKVSELLGSFKNKAGGIDGQLSQPVREAVEASGVQFSPEVKASLVDDPYIQRAAKTLEQSDTTKAGVDYQKSLIAAKQDLSQSALQTMGKDISQVEKLEDLSKYDAGRRVGDALAEEVDAKIKPLAKEFEELKGKVGNVELAPDSFIESPVMDPQSLTSIPRMERVPVPGVTSEASEKIGQLALDQGWLVASDTPIYNLVQFAQKQLPRLKDLTDLSNFISRVGEKAESLSSLTDRSPTRAGAMIKGILKDAEANVIEKQLGQHGPELVERFRNVRGAWREASELVEQVQEHLGVKASTSGYAKALREFAQQDGEALLRRIAGSGNAAGLKLLTEKFPAAANAFRQYHLDAIVKDAAAKAKPGEVLNAKALIKGVDKLSPEMRAFVIPEASAQKLKAIGTILEQMEKAPHNFSNTARTADKLFEYVPGTAVGMATMLAGHNPALALVLGGLTKLVAKDAPDAMRLSMLKFLGSSQPIESGAFKAMVDVARSVIRGEAALTKASKAVLRSGTKAGERDVSENDRKRLDKQLMALSIDPSPLLNSGGSIGHYLPDHASQIGATAANAVSYLNSLRPNTEKAMPLDADPKADPAAKAAFNRALDIAENPLIVLQSVKEGTIVPQDLITLQNVAPGLYARMKQKLTQELVDFSAEENDIPYKTRLGLSLFLGQPLDSTMTPMAIQAMQPMAPAAPQQMPQPNKPTATGMQKLSKIGAENATGGQLRQMSRVKHA